ncbi:MAG: RagB/SusD family nutrient uptake outer membrane protein, partial [Sphingobacteriales bacterium]
YKLVYVTNVSLEKLDASTSLTPELKKRLIGECLYIRAWQYFILVNLFGDVPLCLSSDYRRNAEMPRSDAAIVWEQIISDLSGAADKLPESYALPERTVPNRFAAKALLAKCYLYQQKWDSVLVLCNQVAQSGSYQLLPNMNAVFQRGSSETLWQVASTSTNRNSWEGFNFIPSSNNAAPGYVLRPELVNHFEANDQRKINWLKQRTYAGNTLYYPFKYKVRTSTPPTEFQVVMRYVEVLLMRAEANLQTNGVSSAIPDINAIRLRAGLPIVDNTISSDSCMRLVIKERRSELFAEWGNRWFDLKRWNLANELLAPLKGNGWQPTDVLYPIPQTQIDLNRNLEQNSGY